MNVVPGLTADRAETVLHDIAMARVQSAPGSPAATPAALAASTTAEPPSAVAEREANALLDKGDQARAAAKFAESEKLRSKETSQAAAGLALAAVPATAGPPVVDAAPAVDASVQKSSGAEPATEPVLAAPGADGSPAPDKPAAITPATEPKPEPPAQGDAPVALAPADPPQNQKALADPAKAAAPAALAPAEQPASPAPSGPDASQEPAGKGQQMLASARALYTSGNYPAARQMAEQAKAAHLGVDGQADELLAQIGLVEQGGALSLYESALGRDAQRRYGAGPRSLDRGCRGRRLAGRKPAGQGAGVAQNSRSCREGRLAQRQGRRA